MSQLFMWNLKLCAVLAISALAMSCTSSVAPPGTRTGTAPGTDEHVLLEHLADQVFAPDYDSLQLTTYTLEQALSAFGASPTEPALAAARAAWKMARATWERCYACAVGEMATGTEVGEMDPWPVAYARIDSLLAGTAPLDTIQLPGWENDLKGFHPMEYVLFGPGGAKPASAFTARDLLYLSLLAGNLHALAGQLQADWSNSSPGNYYSDFVNAGMGSPIYSTPRDALLDVANGIETMCDDLAKKNLESPFDSKDPSLDPSPFSGNSITEFIERVQSGERIYSGSGTTSGQGLAALLPTSDSTMDREIRNGFALAIQSLRAISTPFSQAIASGSPQVPLAIAAITNIRTILDTALIPFIQKEPN